MSNTLDTYSENVVMDALLSGDFTNTGNVFEDDVIEKVNAYIFANASNLTSITLSNLKYINNNAFRGLNNTILNLSWDKIISMDGASIFYNTKLPSIIYCPNLKNLGGSYTFGGNSTLSDVTMISCPNMESSQNMQEVFTYRSLLTDLFIPNLGADISNNSISTTDILRRTGITHIIFPQWCYKKIMSGFLYSTPCTFLELGGDFTEIQYGNSMYVFPSTLKTIVLSGLTSVPTITNANYLFNVVDRYVYVPKALEASIKAASGWSDYASQIRAIEDYPSDAHAWNLIYYYIGNKLVGHEYVAYGQDGTGPAEGSFINYGSGMNLLGWTTTSGGSTADANALTNITSSRNVYAVLEESVVWKYLNGTLTSYNYTGTAQLRSLAFFNQNITSLTVPNLTTVINDYVVVSCNSLISASFASATEVTGNYIIYYCNNIQTVDFPELTTVGSSVNTLVYDGNYLTRTSSYITVKTPKLSTINGTTFYLCILGAEYLDYGLITALSQAVTSTYTSFLKYLVLRNTSSVVTGKADPLVFNSSSPLMQGQGKILVPSSMVADYKAYSVWSYVANYIEAIEDNPSIIR